jgi:hypothetical protein
MNFEPHERVSDRHLIGEVIRIGDDWAESLVRCKLEDCHIIVDVPRGGPPIRLSQLRHCTIEAKRRMKNSWFFGSDYISCTFKGKFDGMDFGRSPRPDPITGEMDEYGDLVDCDFTEATLEMCRFFNVDISRQKFAPWPQFVVPYANEVLAAKLQREWPGKFGVHMRLVPRQNPALVATTGTVSDYLKEYDISQEELEQVLEVIGDVIR